jgi:branched-chain amino acid transport system permease protein
MAAVLDAHADIAPNRGASEMRRFLMAAVPLAVALYGLVPLLFGNQPYWLNVLTNACLLSFGSLGVWLTFSIGRVNIAQGAFALIGGYTTGLLTTQLGLSFWLALPLSGPLLRLRGIYFAMVTLSLTEAVRLAFLNAGSIGGANGVLNIPNPPGISSPLAFYLFSASVLLAGFVAIWRLNVSRIGWIFRSMRQNEELAASIGLDVARFRVLAFAICCFMGGISGGCFASLQQNIYPQTYTVSDSINFMLYCFLGGLEFVLGPIVGTFALVIAFELLRSIQEYQALVYGILMIAVMLFLPNGLLSLRSLLSRSVGGSK